MEFLKIQLPRILPRPSESEFLGVGLGILENEKALSVMLIYILCY